MKNLLPILSFILGGFIGSAPWRPALVHPTAAPVAAEPRSYFVSYLVVYAPSGRYGFEWELIGAVQMRRKESGQLNLELLERELLAAKKKSDPEAKQISILAFNPVP